MRAFRLTRIRFSALSGRGSLLASARWHWAGVPMIYCADSRALAVLETLVHTRKDQVPSDYVFYELAVEDASIESVPAANVPKDWKADDPLATRDFGTDWMRSRRSMGLRVPSVVIYEESNLLLNPEHPDFAGVRIIGPQPFEFGRRLFH
jgi:RES domain-containing protein